MIQLTDKVVNKEVRDKAVKRFREKGIILPTFAQMNNPELIPGKIKDQLKNIGFITAPSKFIAIALIVKSRRFKSTMMSVVNSTAACLPSQSLSCLKVVISYGLFSNNIVTVPCFNPVGIQVILLRFAISWIVVGKSGVVKSKSFGF